MLKRVLSIAAVLALVVFFVGCSDSPVAQYDEVNLALEKAREAEADIYAPQLLQQASDSLNAALVEMKKQDDRFAMFRSYGVSEEMLARTKQLAENVAIEAAAEKERVRVADSVLIAQVDSLILETTNALKTAPKGKGSRLDLKVMQADLDAATATLTGIKAEYDAGKYQSANQKLQAVSIQVNQVKGQIQAAILQKTTN